MTGQGPRVHFDQMMERLSKESRAHPHMVRAMVELTYGCNLRCVHCYNPTHQARNELSTKQVLRILDQLAAQGVLWIGFTGGELFTRTDLFEIFRYAKSLGFVISLLTNATLVATPELADRIRDLGLYQMDISVYGATAPTYEQVTRVPGSWLKFVRGVDLLRERQVPLLLKLVLMKPNVHELDAMLEFATSRDLPYKVTTQIFPRVDGSLEPMEYGLSPEQAFEVWKRLSGEGILRNRTSSPEPEEDSCGSGGQLFNCLCGKSSAAVTPYGKMNLCLSVYTPQYDLIAGTVEKGWTELVDLVASAEPGPEYECGGCSLEKNCTRSAKDGWLQQGRVDGPCIPSFRELAEKKSQFLNGPSGA